jgi:glycerol uptake facilitator-like aquaporin
MLQAAVVADQNAKLSIFATRPAIYAPLYNFITEMMGTVALILLALLIELQVSGTGVTLGFSYSPCYR